MGIAYEYSDTENFTFKNKKFWVVKPDINLKI